MQDIKELLPHREPFLYVDRLESYSEEMIVGYRKYRADEYFFPGHFPDYPIVPGVILVETMAQCGGAGIIAMNLIKGKRAFLASVEKARFRRQVRPDDEVRIEVKNLMITPMLIRQAGKAYVGDELAAQAEWRCMITDVA